MLVPSHISDRSPLARFLLGPPHLDLGYGLDKFRQWYADAKCFLARCAPPSQLRLLRAIDAGLQPLPDSLPSQKIFRKKCGRRKRRRIYGAPLYSTVAENIFFYLVATKYRWWPGHVMVTRIDRLIDSDPHGPRISSRFRD